MNYKLDENALLKEYTKALKDPDFKKLVTRLKVKENEAMKHTSKLERTVCELKDCSKCPGLAFCKHEVMGTVYYPSNDEDGLRFNYVACKYKQEQDKLEASRSTCFEEPEIIKNASMADIDISDKNRAKVLKWVKEYYKEYKKDKNSKGCFLHGSFGSGKTFILAALFNELAKNGAHAVIIYYPEMLRNLRESFNDDFASKMYELQHADLLLIDDIGAESVSEWNRDEILGTILQYRMESNLPTFFTSNLNINELETHLSQSKGKIDEIKARRIIERIKQLTIDLELVSENRRK